MGMARTTAAMETSSRMKPLVSARQVEPDDGEEDEIEPVHVGVRLGGWAATLKGSWPLAVELLAVHPGPGKDEKRSATKQRVEAAGDRALDDGTQGPHLVGVVADQDEDPERQCPEGRAQQGLGHATSAPPPGGTRGKHEEQRRHYQGDSSLEGPAGERPHQQPGGLEKEGDEGSGRQAPGHRFSPPS